MDNDELLIKIKDMFDSKVEEVKRHTSVLVENLESKVQAVAEGHDILNRKIDKVDRTLGEVKQNVKVLKQDVEVLKQDVKGLKTDMDVVKGYVIGVDAKLNEHEVILKRVK